MSDVENITAPNTERNNRLIILLFNLEKYKKIQLIVAYRKIPCKVTLIFGNCIIMDKGFI
jgi:hypothetical protein